MWAHLSIVGLLLQASPQAQPRLEATPAAPPSARDAANYAVLRFLSTWRTGWLESVDWRSFDHPDIRLRDVHCHWDGSFSPSGMRGYYPSPTIIHRSSRRSMCPNWLPSDDRVADDERIERDVAMTPAWRRRVHDARAALLDTLAQLDHDHPGDDWITGERVRFLVDQGELREAVAIARGCTAGHVWCAQLAGFALHAADDFAAADSAFDAAGAAMAPTERCEWTDIAPLLDPDGRSAYAHSSCAERERVNERAWWLSTPLFSDPVNDRRSEDFSRKVLSQLHAALPWDERFDWRERYGGDAVREMLVRYGWPAYSEFAGAREEEGHAGWMMFYDSTRTATIEYPEDRLHLVPDWRAVGDPFRATSDAWHVNAPRFTDDEEPASQWWPAEHYARAAGTIVQLDQQTVMLRRDADVLLATAADVASVRRTVHVDAAQAVLVRTTAPHVVERVPRQSFGNASAIVVTGHIPSQPAVVGMEVSAHANGGGPSVRTRFGVVPPAPLSALHPGEPAISDPALLSADDDPPADPTDALAHMLGSSRVRGAKVGVYWETYGFSPSDSVDVSIVIARHETISAVRRIGMFLHVAHDLNGAVAVRWNEPQAGHDAWTVPGNVPIQARSVRLDLSRIEPGHYIVEVVVAHHGGLPVTSSRAFTHEGR